jgi:hypothetical protein
LARSARFLFSVFRSLLFQAYGVFRSLRSLLFRVPGVFRSLVFQCVFRSLLFQVYGVFRSLLFKVYGVVGSLRSLLFRVAGVFGSRLARSARFPCSCACRTLERKQCGGSRLARVGACVARGWLDYNRLLRELACVLLVVGLTITDSRASWRVRCVDGLTITDSRASWRACGSWDA